MNAEHDDRARAISELESEFGELFHLARRLMSENAERMSPGMLPGVYKVFTTIVRLEQVTLSTLAETLMADKGQISRAVRDLESAGFVARTPDAADKRSHLIAPTPLGIERLAAARAPQESSFLTALERWKASDIEDLARLLRALRHGGDPRAV